jgi:hypothetical protein
LDLYDTVSPDLREAHLIGAYCYGQSTIIGSDYIIDAKQQGIGTENNHIKHPEIRYLIMHMWIRVIYVSLYGLIVKMMVIDNQLKELSFKI